MLETAGSENAVVRNYTSNFDVKEYIQDYLIPMAFPNIPVNKLNLGFTGVASEMISSAIEDAYGTATLMMNEAFVNRAVLPKSIYSAAALYDLGYTFATPSRCHFAVQLWIPDIIQYSTKVRSGNSMRYYLDKDTYITIGNNQYRFDYDVIIDHQFIDGKRVFNVYYDIGESNSISGIRNKFIKHHVTAIDWLVIFVELKEYSRKVDTNTISDNLITTNSDIKLRWSGQIAGIDLVYIDPRGERFPMLLKTQYSRPSTSPFVWYQFIDDNQIALSFSSSKSAFNPAFNSQIESTIYTCNGSLSNFDAYDNKTGLDVSKSGERFAYNANTKMVALCYSGSVGGLNKADIELLRDDVVAAYNTANVLTTDHDLQMWFDRYAKRYDSRCKFFKRRDDPSGRLFSQFVAIMDNTYVYPTNTLTIDIKPDQFDFINNDENGINKEFIIKPGHIWEYDDSEDEQVRDRLRMVQGIDGPAMVTDDALPLINPDRPFMFTNPFYIKIHRDPTVACDYNCLVNHTSWPEDVPIQTDCFYQFQLATFTIERSISKTFNNKYRIQVICVPAITSNIEYIKDPEREPDANYKENNLRLVMIIRNSVDGESGYIEMVPIEKRNNGAILYQTEIAVNDNLQNNMMLEVDQANSPGMKSLICTGPHTGKIFIDAVETSFHFACMMKDFAGKMTTNLFGDEEYAGYMMANRFANSHRDLSLYQAMSMMRHVITFSGENNNYSIRLSLVPMLKYDVPLNDDRMLYFIRAFDEQYHAVEPVLSKLDGNTFLDFKLFNTYGRSNNYYVGPEDGKDVLWDSNLLLDSVYVGIKFIMAVYDRSMYNQTVEAVINEIKVFFESMNTGERVDVHVSDLIHAVICHQPNVHYLRFVGFNEYDARKQSIFVKYDDISELREDQLQPHVPEMIYVDSESIKIIEEV